MSSQKNAKSGPKNSTGATMKMQANKPMKVRETKTTKVQETGNMKVRETKTVKVQETKNMKVQETKIVKVQESKKNEALKGKEEKKFYSVGSQASQPPGPKKTETNKKVQETKPVKAQAANTKKVQETKKTGTLKGKSDNISIPSGRSQGNQASGSRINGCVENWSVSREYFEFHNIPDSSYSGYANEYNDDGPNPYLLHRRLHGFYDFPY